MSATIISATEASRCLSSARPQSIGLASLVSTRAVSSAIRVPFCRNLPSRNFFARGTSLSSRCSMIIAMFGCFSLAA